MQTFIAQFKPTWRLLCPLFAALILASLQACSAPTPPTEQELMMHATRNFQEGDYVTAVENYDKLLEQFPFSPNVELAGLRIAQAYYRGMKYDKAVEAFNDFERLHPTSPLLPFVQYTVGMSYLDQATLSDRDKTASENALRQFERVRDRYPDSFYGRLARYRIHQAQENLALHELSVGDFYLAKGQVETARGRYEHLISEYPSSDSAVDARQRLASTDSTSNRH